jgi:hypothetical protein
MEKVVGTKKFLDRGAFVCGDSTVKGLRFVRRVSDLDCSLLLGL